MHWFSFALSSIFVCFQFLSARADVVTFEDLSLPPSSYQNGSGLSPAGSFTSGGAVFNNSYDSTYGSWSGWSYSNVNDVTTPGYGNQYAAYTLSNSGKGAGSSANYAVAYDNSPGDSTILLPTGQRPLSMQVTNTTYAALTMKNGDSFGDTPFAKGDFFLLTINGLDANGNSTGSIPFYLAQPDDTNQNIVSDWTNVNLSSLSDTTTMLSFGLTTSQNDQYGPLTPTYFAIDDLQTAAVPEPGPMILLSFALAVFGIVWRFKKQRAMFACS